jgi:nickel-type superoxide dismutase maturation protease
VDVRLLPFRIFRVADRSMEPSVEGGSYVLVNCWVKEFAPGDIVVLKPPKYDMTLLKRVSKVDEGMVSVIGDNKKLSVDSRKFGPVPQNAVIGKVLLVI